MKQRLRQAKRAAFGLAWVCCASSASAQPASASASVSVSVSVSAPASASALDHEVVGDAIPNPLTNVPGDAARGRAIVVNRQLGLCLLCHTGPFPEEPFQGTLAPSLAGAGARGSAGQLRLRLVDARRVNPASFMPAYYRAEGHVQVAGAWQGKPVFSAQQVEDVVAFLQTLRE